MCISNIENPAEFLNVISNEDDKCSIDPIKAAIDSVRIDIDREHDCYEEMYYLLRAVLLAEDISHENKRDIDSALAAAKEFIR